MNKIEMTEALVAAKLEKGVTWEEAGTALGMSPVWLASACLGMNSAPSERAQAIADYFGQGSEVASALEVFPTKTWGDAVPQDPLVYRLYEIVGVYGDTLKEIIQEKFGDGIMSAIDFSMEVDKQEDPKGDRVLLTMSGKFLKYNNW